METGRRVGIMLLLYLGTPSLVSTAFAGLFDMLQHEKDGFERRLDYKSIDQTVLDDSLRPSDNENPSSSNFASLQPFDGVELFSALVDAISVMQAQFFEVWVGNWPEAIDWTAAVMSTHISATLSSMSDFTAYHFGQLTCEESLGRVKARRKYENLINQYFTQITAYYFGENDFSLRSQAFDDMLWVVLGWLESIKFINSHSRLNRSFKEGDDDRYYTDVEVWYGRQFIPQFAHRARLFYDLASNGWNTSLCGGGMIWSPYLAPYKNAITNQLFIAASIGMYLYFPGDDNSSPFYRKEVCEQATGVPPAEARDPKYLAAAIEAYNWLSASNMTNDQGLYVDGYHIRGWRGGKNGSQGSGNCDIRDEMVYTYNQGVILSGMRGLYTATGSTRYLADGHILIRNVIKATGWHHRHTEDGWRWAGLGRGGVLEDTCDAKGTCSQDGQTFKGIFFHHLTAFCMPLDGDVQAPKAASEHLRNCEGYSAWVRYNARAAAVTRDSKGRFGMWWGRHSRHPGDDIHDENEDPVMPAAATDHRNAGIPRTTLWRLPVDLTLESHSVGHLADAAHSNAVVFREATEELNDQGTGRTVEMHSGGLAVLRAAWSVGNTAGGVQIWGNGG